MESLGQFPIAFWVSVAALGWGGVVAFGRVKDGSGIPMLAVLATVAVWYNGDALYNDYATYMQLFAPETLNRAWWQVVCFVVVLILAAPRVHDWFNAGLQHRRSGAMMLFRQGVDLPWLQGSLCKLFLGTVTVWSVILVIAAIRVKGHFLYYLFPFLGYKVEPWGRGRIGGGFDALITVAAYLQFLVSAVFGVVAALSTKSSVRSGAFFCCFCTWPYVLLDRTRNNMLLVVIPGILCWSFLRVRGGLWKNMAAIGVFFVIVNFWMGFVIKNRVDNSISRALKEKGFRVADSEKVKHEGLNMFEELCWISTFLERGSMAPNWGARYFAEGVNWIPRPLWPGKPTLGIDYSILRGQGLDGGQAGIGASISTGLIGQGVTNFGPWLGSAAAALIMSFWVAVLARLDLELYRLGRLPLYALGLILTFNLGRDITLITLYSFVFGWVGLAIADRLLGKRPVAIALNGPSFSPTPSLPPSSHAIRLRAPQLRYRSVNRSRVGLSRGRRTWPRV